MIRFLAPLLLLACAAIAEAQTQIATTVTMSLPASISQGDQSAGVAITVAGTDGSVPSGTAHLSFSGYGTFTHTLVNGSTKYTLYSLPVGTYQVQASYLPLTQGYATGASSTQTLTVVNGGIATGVYLQMPTQIVFGDQTNDVAFVRAYEASGGGIPRAEVQLSISNFGVFTHTTDSDAGYGPGATIFGLGLPPGVYQVQAIFQAQNGYAASKSDVFTLAVVTVPPITTTTSVTLPSTITQGDRSQYATVDIKAANHGPPTGTVQLTFSGFGTFTHPVPFGSTDYKLYSLPVGTYQVQASYQAQFSYAASTSPVYTLTVLSGQ